MFCSRPWSCQMCLSKQQHQQSTCFNKTAIIPIYNFQKNSTIFLENIFISYDRKNVLSADPWEKLPPIWSILLVLDIQLPLKSQTNKYLMILINILNIKITRSVQRLEKMMNFDQNFEISFQCSTKSLKFKEFYTIFHVKKRNKDVECIAVVTSFLRIFIIYLIVYICYSYTSTSFFEKISFQKNTRFHKNDQIVIRFGNLLSNKEP